MVETTELPKTTSLWQKARGAVPFLLSLLFCLWLLRENTQPPLVGSAGRLSALPAFLMTGLTFTLLALRADEVAACLLAVYMSTLAVLARYNTIGLNWLPESFSVEPASHLSSYAVIPILWVFALGGVPLYFGWVYTERTRDQRRTPMQRLIGLTFLSLCALGQAACLYVAIRGIHGVFPMQVIVNKIPSPYHRLLLYSAPVLLTEHAVAFWLLLRHYQRHGNARNRALVLIFGIAFLFVLSIIINDMVARPETNILANIMAYLTPLLVVYAIETHALFDIRIFLRRTLQFTITRQAITLLPLVGLAFLWGLTVNTGAASGLGRVHEMLIFLIVIFSAALVLRLPILRASDRNYFREIYDAQRVLGDTGRSLVGVSDTGEIARTALAVIDIFLRPNNALFLSEEEGEIRCLAQRAHADYVPPRHFDRALLSLNKVEEVPDMDRLSSRPRWTDTLPDSARALLRETDTHLVVPLREAERTIGVILLGEKRASGAGAIYAPEDIDMLRALASQVALALQSAYLNRNRAVLQRSTHELKAGSVSFVQLVERERNLLAADLHDQTLPELRFLLAELQAWADALRHAQEQAPSGPLPFALTAPGRITPEQMVDHLRQSIENIRDIMESLRPSALEMLGLYPALENELRKSAARARPPVVPQFRVLNETRPANLSSFAEMSVFRIVQEAINNACRHAQAKTVRVQIGAINGMWTLRVDDDGTGIPQSRRDGAGQEDEEIEVNGVIRKEPRRSGHGLYNMRYRASLIGAELTWETPDWGKGAGVVLRLPLNAPPEAI